MDRAPQSWWRTVVCGMALAICSLMFCLLAIEAVARTFRLLPPPSQNFRFSPTKGYELVPGHKEINSHGLRDREYSVVKPPHTFRILALGDSFTYGDGVALEETWMKDLERRLNRQLGDTGIHFEVLNAGIPGYNTHQELIHLQDVGLQFDPNLVVVEFTLNDAELGMMGLGDDGFKGCEKASLAHLRQRVAEESFRAICILQATHEPPAQSAEHGRVR